MLVNLPSFSWTRSSSPVEFLNFATNAPGSTVVFHPRFATWLRRVGLDSAPAILGLQGEIVCGHPDRHVVRIELPNGRLVYLKREHVVGWSAKWKNRLAGFGAISRSEREALTLQELEEAGLPCPQWLAYGKSDDGRAFLLIDNLAGGRELSECLTDKNLSATQRRMIAARIGSTLADYHDAGFATPDLSAKHVFVCSPSFTVNLIDWQSTPLPGVVSWVDRVRSLARLLASMPTDSTSRAERFALARSYLAHCTRPKPNLNDFARSIEREAKGLRRKSSARHQQLAGSAVRLVWVDDERVVTIPELAKQWPSALEEAARGQYSEHKTFAPLGRLMAWLRGRPWRSPAAEASRVLNQLQRSNVPAPRLLAYGHTLLPFARSTSFLLTDRPADAEPLKNPTREMLVRCGRLLRQLHDAGVVLKSSSPFLVSHGKLLVNAPNAVKRSKRIGLLRILRDWKTVCQSFETPLSRAERMQVFEAYWGRQPLTGWRLWFVNRFVIGGWK